jgi:hypothetical protein
MSEQLVEALGLIVAQNRASVLHNIRLIYNYDPATNIELWLRLFNDKANRLGLDDSTKIEQLPSYLPVHIAQWVLSNPVLQTWDDVRRELITTYGIPIVQQRQICRAKLEKLRQGRLPTRQFKAQFQSIIQELPDNTTLPSEVLRSYSCEE